MVPEGERQSPLDRLRDGPYMQSGPEIGRALARLGSVRAAADAAFFCKCDLSLLNRKEEGGWKLVRKADTTAVVRTTASLISPCRLRQITAT